MPHQGDIVQSDGLVWVAGPVDSEGKTFFTPAAAPGTRKQTLKQLKQREGFTWVVKKGELVNNALEHVCVCAQTETMLNNCCGNGDFDYCCCGNDCCGNDCDTSRTAAVDNATEYLPLICEQLTRIVDLLEKTAGKQKPFPHKPHPAQKPHPTIAQARKEQHGTPRHVDDPAAEKFSHRERSPLFKGNKQASADDLVESFRQFAKNTTPSDVEKICCPVPPVGETLVQRQVHWLE